VRHDSIRPPLLLPPLLLLLLPCRVPLPKAASRRRSCWPSPLCFDLVATVLMNIGLLSATASVYQMMRGAEMLFAALFAVLFLRRHLNKFHYLGISCCAVSSRCSKEEVS